VDYWLSLGRAVAISGAAIDPFIGSHRSTVLTALMTVFNTRLGWWLENPRREGWAARCPAFGGLLLHELFGRTDEYGHYVHLSDGGHFENLGVYELIRRRCRYIVACDAGQDGAPTFDDLAQLQRLCRTDFGIRVEIDTSPLERRGADKRARWHCAIGQIHYEDIDAGVLPGILVYVKASLTGDEPADVLNYAAKHPDFPHQTTADQFFDEKQFEAYRMLGEHVAAMVFTAATEDSNLKEIIRSVPPDAEDFYTLLSSVHQSAKVEHSELFSQLRARWFPAPPEIEASYEQTAHAYRRLHDILRRDRRLKRLGRELYAEIDALGVTRAELHMVCRITQVLEQAWLGVRLEGYPEHPINRGWMNNFRRVARSHSFQRAWLGLRGGFDQEFVRFCERELRLGERRLVSLRLAHDATGAWEFVPDADASGERRPVNEVLTALEQEFRSEWPRRTSLVELLERAFNRPVVPGEGPAAWVVAYESFDFYHGLILAWQAMAPRDPTDVELFVWLRGAYRNLGIGRHTLGRTGAPDSPLGWLVDTLKRSSPQQDWAVITRYPETRPGVATIEKQMWRNFFYQLDFRFRAESDFEDRNVLSGRELVMEYGP
jgi:hypothetical protein